MQRRETRYRDAKLFGVLTIWTILSITLGECNRTKGRLPDTSLLTNFIRKFIKPYIQSLQFDADTPYQRSSKESPVHKVVREVIEDLKPFLQDEDRDDRLELKDSGETAIIEFLPKQNQLRSGKESSVLQQSIRKYEKIKAEIKTALDREAVEDKTKKMVARTLDELIAQVIRNQCIHQPDHSLAVFRTGEHVNHNITLDKWEDLKFYLDFLEKESENADKYLELFNAFQVFISKAINDPKSLMKKYAIHCQLIKKRKKESKNTSFGRQETKRAQDSCTDFKICSEELREFLLDLYKTLNDTSVSVFKNYAAMYERDVTVNDDSNDKDSVPAVLDNLGNATARRVTKVFIQELIMLKLDKTKNKEANIKILREYVRRTCKRAQKHLKKHLATDLASLKPSLLLTVEQDININLGVDLGNLEADMKGKICTVFVTCNGRVSQTRRTLIGSVGPSIDSNSVYVKVQVSLDDKLKDDIVSANKEIFRSMKNKPKQEKFEMLRRYENMNVTRTTIMSESTKQLDSNLSDINHILNNSVLDVF